MKRVNRIYHHPLYQKHFTELQATEKDRIFCNHTMEHFLDVARLMYIYNLEAQTALPKELIYAAALLHDIGRNEQYQIGTPHEQAGCKIAEIIMAECAFSSDEIRMVQYAIASHRNSTAQTRDERSDVSTPLGVLLSDYLYRADKQSRNCFSCRAFAECNWSAQKKNMEIIR